MLSRKIKIPLRVKLVNILKEKGSDTYEHTMHEFELKLRIKHVVLVGKDTENSFFFSEDGKNYEISKLAYY